MADQLPWREQDIRDKMMRKKTMSRNARSTLLHTCLAVLRTLKREHTMLGQVSMRDGMAGIIQNGSGARYRVGWKPPSPKA